MRVMRYMLICFCLGAACPASAQLVVTPFAGINNTKMSGRSSVSKFENGGSFGFGGIDVEWQKKAERHKRLKVSVAAGASYLSNGFFRAYNFSISSLYYSHTVIDMKTKYLQVPVMIRVNYQPFVLMDELQVFFGAGVCNNILLKASLVEEYAQSFISSGSLPPPPQTFYYRDSRDVTSLRSRSSMFMRAEIGFKYKRLMLAYRFTRAFQDLYCSGLEASWAVPADKSEYISAHLEQGKILEKNSELVLGFRLFVR